MANTLPERAVRRLPGVPKLGALHSPNEAVPRRLPPIVGGIVIKLPSYNPPAAPGAIADLTGGNNWWSSLGNTTTGDCVLAACVHLVQVWSSHARGIMRPVQEQQVLDAYTKITGWNPADPMTDVGMHIRSGLDYLISDGIADCRITRAKRICVGMGNNGGVSRDDLCSYIAWLGGVVLGISLPKKAHDALYGPWAGNMGGDSDGGHAIVLVAYDSGWFECITWGNVIKVDWEFICNYTFEAWLCSGPDWFMASGNSADFGLSSVDLDITLDTCAIWNHVPV